MQLADLVAVSARVSATRSRLQKVDLLAECIRRAAPNITPIVVGYLVGELPQGKVGVGYATVHAIGETPAAGEGTLRVDDVDAAFSEVQAISGAGANAKRTERLGQLFARATHDEQRFLVRLMLGEMRHGALEGVVVDAVARAFDAQGDAVRRAVMFAGTLPPVAQALAEAGKAGLERFRLEIFQPVQPMLADTAADGDEAITRLGEAALEYKLDGARVQVHKDGERVEVYSRSLHRVTAAVPEVVEMVAALPARKLVFDGEAIALGEGHRPLPFQIIMRRFGRKLDVARIRDELPLSAFFFDAIRVDDDTLIDRPLRDRWEALMSATGGRGLVPRIVTTDAHRADEFFAQATADGHEGIMAKGLDAGYRAGKRGQEWLKLKPAHTFDLVVLAAEWGSGRRQGWLSNLHLGARDPATSSFVMLGKTFKGMTDEVLRWQTEALLAREIGREGHVVHVRPELVVEIAFNDVQKSPYPGGVALRFARLKRYRPDKRAEDADTIERVVALLPKGH